MSTGELLVIAFMGLFGAGVLIFVLLQIWTYRYIWKDGYYRIVYYNEDKHMVPVMMRLKAVRSFDMVVEGIKHRFEIDSDYIFTQGRFKIRTIHYVLRDLRPKGGWVIKNPSIGHKATAFNPLDDDPVEPDEENRDSIEFAKVANNTVTTQLLDSFKEPFLSPGVAILLIGVVVIIGFVVLGFWQNDKFTKLEEQIFAQPTATTRFESPGVVVPGTLQ